MRPWTSLQKRFSVLALVLVVAATHAGAAGRALAEQPLDLSSADTPNVAVERAIRDRWTRRGVQPAAGIDDAAFLRRVTLDLAGRLPTEQELASLEDRGKPEAPEATVWRAAVVDRLLASPDYPRHMADVFDVLLMGRGNPQDHQRRRQNGWRDYLERVFADNRPWNQVAREILLARPESAEQRGSTWFLFERQDKHQEIAEAIAPAVFGFRIECAQCHDHPLAAEIEQRHYWGLVAFFRRGKNVGTKNGPRVAESAVGGFEQFADLGGDSHPNLLAFLDASVVDEPRPAEGDKQQDEDGLYVPAPIEGDPRLPKFSRRRQFVDQVLADHPRVSRAMVNRIWALLLGRGLVHPFDEMDSWHPPSHPELLDWLAQDFAASGYDVRRLVRSLVLSQPYQLEARRPAPDADPADFSWALEKPLTAETWVRSVARLVHGPSPGDSEALLNVLRAGLPDVLPDEPTSSVAQALLLTNNPVLREFLRSRRGEGHLVDRLLALPDHEARVERLFRLAYCRPPDAEEQVVAVGYLQEREDRLETAVHDLIWAVVTSAEFRFNH